MKKFILCMCAVLLIGLSDTTNAQVSVRININSQPAWGPSGYDRANFYYFPDLNIYFDVNNSIFYYLSGSKWTSNRYLPNRYGKYDFYKLHKVVINNESRPWLKNVSHRKEYMRFKGDRNQTPIKLSKNSRYNQSKENSRMWIRNENQGPDQKAGQREGQRKDQKVDQRKDQHSNNKHKGNDDHRSY